MPPSFPSALLGGTVGFGLLFLAYLIGRGFIYLMGRLRQVPPHRQAFGLGDVRLGAFVGLMVGFPLVLPALLISILLGGLFSIVYLLVRAAIARRYSPFASIAYSPFLAAGALITILCIPSIELPLPPP
jgi:prepilin signal peptidase PulO-like enzyme (type II secretory pathway)